MRAAELKSSPAESANWDKALTELRSGLRGPVRVPGEPEYEAARRVFNGMIDRHPRLIVQPQGVADVIRAVEFARTRGVPLAVKGGGHNVAGNAICDDGVVLDLSRMRGVQVDRVDRSAWVEAGATWADVDRETQVHGLATPGGRVSSTGVAGFTLGGGIGWLSRQHGLACDNLLAVDLVTADGRALRASPVEHPDLFWGLRGGGGNFGVVTRFQFRLHPVGPAVYGGLLAFPGELGGEILPALARYAASAPPQLSVVSVLITAPPAPFIPKEFHGKHLVGIAALWNGPVAAGESVMRPIRTLGPAVVDHIGPMEYLQLQGMFDALNPSGLLNYWKSQYLETLSPGAIAAVMDRWAEIPSPLSEIHFEFLGGGIGGVGEGESAYSNRAATVLMNYVGKWTDPAETDANIRFIRGLWDATAPFSTRGTYVNFLADASPEIVRSAYGGDKFDRLAKLKATYDPNNFFRANANIPPAPK